MFFECGYLDVWEVVFDEVDLIDYFAEDEVRVEVLAGRCGEEFVEGFARGWIGWGRHGLTRLRG